MFGAATALLALTLRAITGYRLQIAVGCPLGFPFMLDLCRTAAANRSYAKLGLKHLQRLVGLTHGYPIRVDLRNSRPFGRNNRSLSRHNPACSLILNPKLDQTAYRVPVRHRDRAGFLHSRTTTPHSS